MTSFNCLVFLLAKVLYFLLSSCYDHYSAVGSFLGTFNYIGPGVMPSIPSEDIVLESSRRSAEFQYILDLIRPTVQYVNKYWYPTLFNLFIITGTLAVPFCVDGAPLYGLWTCIGVPFMDVYNIYAANTPFPLQLFIGAEVCICSFLTIHEGFGLFYCSGCHKILEAFFGAPITNYFA